MELDKNKLEKAAYILKTIAHPTRLAVIAQLQNKAELSVNELIEKTGCEQSLLSHHLTNMRSKGLLQVRKEGTSSYYSLRELNLSSVLACIEKCDCYM
ncbi:MAG: metalloregulator ArsR/SmtB family transcription factor [Bacteroidia bacterium]|nr:metalloregulator ArsR/SmtB family transcription factor [Bacteroidia bacterium]